MSFLQKLFNPRAAKVAKKKNKEMLAWESTGFAMPSPHFIKQACLLRNGIEGGQWVETGTYLGETTALLAANGSHVTSLEPAGSLYQRAVERFRNIDNVTLINAPSEEVFPALLRNLKGEICFWLDGHFSAGDTFQGGMDTPITVELACIEENLPNFSRLVVMVDDVRCFNPENPEYAQYPRLNYLVDWANKNKMAWHIEHDIFVARLDQRSA